MSNFIISSVETDIHVELYIYMDIHVQYGKLAKLTQHSIKTSSEHAIIGKPWVALGRLAVA